MDTQVISALLDNKVLTYKDMQVDIISTDRLNYECEIGLLITKGKYKLRYTYFLWSNKDINTVCECIINKAYEIITEYIQGLEDLDKEKEFKVEESEVGVLYHRDCVINYEPL